LQAARICAPEIGLRDEASDRPADDRRRRSAMSRSRPFLLMLLLTATSADVLGEEPGFHRGEWPFTPLARPPVPETRRDDWGINPVDSFILTELEKRNLEPSIAADRATLLRRVTFDLTGLPPTIEEIEAFLTDNSPLAYETAVDRLLSSPRFGQRWARHWLDVVRFADTAGFKTDYLRPDAYRYRDYVIGAFNDDLPLNRFVAQQIAGDELEPGNPDALIATGMLRLYAEESTAADFVKMRQDILDDITETAGLSFLGLTMGCAKCHDHKFDPIQQTDFFRLEACFAAIVPSDDRPPVASEVLANYERQYKVWDQATAEIRRQIDEITNDCWADAIETVTVAYDGETRQAWLTPVDQRTTRQHQLVSFSNRYVSSAMRRRIRRLEGEAKAQYDELQKKLAEFDALKPQPLPTSMAVREGTGPVPVTHVLATGDVRKPQEEVTPGFPEFLGRSEPERDAAGVSPTSPSQGPSHGRRSALARWLTLPDHPLTTRVMINRLWQHHFGRGIVATPNDFGAMGDPPSHPRLLDWLSSELVEKNWSLKAIHRLMVTSATYRQSSLVDSAAQARAMQVDPENKYLWKANRVRLEAEPIRDSLVYLSGRLNENMAGPSAYPVLSAAVRENGGYAWTPDPLESQHYRRSIYCFQKRNLRLPLLASFDQPDMYMSCGLRTNTLTPTQSLSLFNGDEAITSARRWAGRLLRDTHGNDAELIRRAWLEAFGRSPSHDESESASRFLIEQGERIYDYDKNMTANSLPDPCPSCLEPQHAGAYVDMCHALLNSSEFLFVD